jgi:NADH dehydrogenase
MANAIPKIVIVGGGAGGLELSSQLGDRLGKKNKASITLVNDTLTHIWKPLLHEVAAGTLDSHEDELSYIALAKLHHFDFELGQLRGINRAERCIEVSYFDCLQKAPQTKLIFYDALVLAVGSITSDFNVPGAKEHCFFLDNLQQAETLQKAFLYSFMQPQTDPQMKIEVAIIGGGATGVELAAELYYAAEQFHHYNLGIKDNLPVHITIIEAGKRLLSAVPDPIANQVLQDFSDKNITILTEQKVTQVTKSGVYVNDRFIPTHFNIWCAGVRCADYLSHIGGLETTPTNQIIVNEYLQTPSDPRVFAIGDCAAFRLPNEKLAPPRAQTAQQEALLLAKSFELFLKKQRLMKFHYQDRGSIISLSRPNAVGQITPQKGVTVGIRGRLARWVYSFLYKHHQAILLGWWKTFLFSLSHWLTKPIRLRLKLH